MSSTSKDKEEKPKKTAPKEEAFLPTHDKDTTKTWVTNLQNLQPKQGEVGKIADGTGSGLKGEVVRKAAARKTLTIRDGKPTWVLFDDEGKELGTEPVPGH